MSRVLVIHTVRTLVEYFDRKLRKAIPSTDFFHILDEALLERIRLRGNVGAEDTERLESHLAEGLEIGASAVLVSCSTLSRCVAQMPGSGRLRVLTIDAALADAIVSFQGSIAVLATNPTTVEPTRQTLATRGLEPGHGSRVAIHAIAGAFAALQRGDLKTHDEIVAASVNDYLGRYDRVALAQASMARATELLTDEQRGRVFSSPDLAVESLAGILKEADEMASRSTPAVRDVPS
ncbi:MAG: aspartate/glutamate racemase family protein [Bryobacteraceae bacterium]